MYRIFSSNQYQKSLKRVIQHKNFNAKKLDEVISLLKSGGTLDAKYRDHELKGEFLGVRECHIQSDILLLYRKEDGVLVLVLVNIGSHSYLFE